MFFPCHAPPSNVAVAVCAIALSLSCSACGAPAGDRATATGSSSAAPFVDDVGDTLAFTVPAARIVSLNPVITEALFALGAGSRLVGRTRWDASPVAVRDVADVGDGMQPNVESVLAVRPDLVVLYASDANRAAAGAFRRAGVPTLTLRTDRVSDFARALGALGRAIGDTAAARVVADSVRRSLDAVRAAPSREAVPTVFWYAWDNPVITIGAGSFLDELVGVAGARNVFGDLAQPSPQVTLEAVAQRNPDFILAGPRTAAALRRDARWQVVGAVRHGRVLVIDTSVVGRPGVRMGEAARSLRILLDSARGARP